MADPWIILAACAAEGLTGYSTRLPHPVAWVGSLISVLEGAWNDPARPAAMRRALGAATLAVVAVSAALAGALIERAASHMPWGGVVVALAGAFGLAGRSLYDHVVAVARPLAAGEQGAARTAVARIVGRDVAGLDEAGVAAAALESLAESFNDGVVAPLFWFALASLPGLFAYKAINTADSMIGHMEPRWRDFGRASARADDLLNLVPARIAGGLLCLVAGRGWGVMRRDAPKHASPNAGWPEAAMSGALGVSLGGPAAYEGVVVERPDLGTGPRPSSGDLGRGLRLYLRACAAIVALLFVGGLAWPR